MSARYQLGRAFAALVGVTILGTVGFSITEGWSAWRSLYFTLVTITTVGYGDYGITNTGMVLAAFLLVGGIGVASYTFALAVKSAVMAELFWRPRMQARIDKLQSHVVVCGYGRMGRTVCHELSAADSEFVVIERDPELFQEAVAAGLCAVQGAAGDDDVMTAAGIERASHLVAIVNSDIENIVIVLTARELNSDLVIVARAERDDEVRKLRRAGADHIVCRFAAAEWRSPPPSSGPESRNSFRGRGRSPPAPA